LKADLYLQEQAKVFMAENMSKQAIIKVGEEVVVWWTSIGRT
jgi:hypothetical protein